MKNISDCRKNSFIFLKNFCKVSKTFSFFKHFLWSGTYLTSVNQCLKFKLQKISAFNFAATTTELFHVEFVENIGIFFSVIRLQRHTFPTFCMNAVMNAVISDEGQHQDSCFSVISMKITVIYSAIRREKDGCSHFIFF